MKKRFLRTFSIGGTALLALVFAGVMARSAAGADMDIHISIPLPRLIIPAPPFLVVIPGTYVYYPPDVNEEIFFYRGYWYRTYHRRWYRSADYNGPWHITATAKVPRGVREVPRDYRRGPGRSERVPYNDVRKHWRSWERDRYWEKHDHGRKRHGRDDRDDRDDRGGR